MGSILNIIQTFAICATLGVLIWYTFETAGLRTAANKQNDISLRPCIVIDLSNRWIRNIGHSPALDVQIDELNIENHYFRFNKYPIIEPGKNDVIDFLIIGKQDPPNTHYQYQHSLEKIGSDFILIIRYKNIENIRYISKIQVLTNYEKANLIETSRVK
jgi:hypothetical protein